MILMAKAKPSDRILRGQNERADFYAESHRNMGNRGQGAKGRVDG